MGNVNNLKKVRMRKPVSRWLRPEMLQVDESQTRDGVNGPPGLLSDFAAQRLYESFSRFAASAGQNVPAFPVADSQNGIILKDETSNGSYKY